MPDDELRAVLADAGRLGSIGPADLDEAIAHARGFLAVLRPCRRLLDLGSGGGLPGLVVAVDRPDLDVVLIDASERRTDGLRRAVGRLGLAGRVAVVCERAEVLGRTGAWRGQADAVVARSFGPPASAAECAAPLLRVGGQLVVSEPPEDDVDRWPASGLDELGMVRDPVPGRYASFTQARPCPDRFPRRSLHPKLFA